MGAFAFSPAQKEVLDVMACIDNNEDLTELKYTLVNFLNERLQRKLDNLWDEGTLSQEKLDQWGAAHLRTSYKQ